MATPTRKPLAAVQCDCSQAAERIRASDLLPLIYDELRALARRFLDQERSNHTLQPTALVHEAYVRLDNQAEVDLKGQTHFRALAAQAMERVLIDYARAHSSAKRGGGRRRVALTGIEPAVSAAVDLFDFAPALERLAKLDPRAAQLVTLRYFGGLTTEEAAQRLGISPATCERDWVAARAFLRRELAAATSP